MADDTTTPSEAAADTAADDTTAELTAPESADAVALDATGDDDAAAHGDVTDMVDDASADADEQIDVAAIQAQVANPPSDARYQATGKRKRSVARVILTPGDGTFWVNGRTLDNYFTRSALRSAVMEPLEAAGAVGAYHVRTRLHGGGVTGQAEALRHGIAKALSEIDPAVRRQLKSKGFLKVDTRQVERKKAGLKKARKRPQFSKR